MALRSPQRGELPTWVMLLGSLLLLVHLGGLTIAALDAPSGPWATPYGADMAMPPPFAEAANRVSGPLFHQALRIAGNYHFPSNRPSFSGVYMVAKLKDAEGKVFKTLRFPDEQAPEAVRHRQFMLIRWLADDLPVPPPEGEVIPAPNQRMNTLRIWDMVEPRRLRLREVPEHLIPRDRPVFRPSDWTLLVTASYARYLCRLEGAASVEIVRHSREPISPVVIMGGDAEPESLLEMESHFGEYRHE